ncbi:hypothetical protein SAMN02745124_04311 [Desulfofustis glycolicus DSM 9705]|uniref:Cadherin-like domain-containing protein n=2 Tax=Desulfofustis glycolicus TaxID=51195 RepID=A0A1M5YQA3_9BACT|nr:hypothetical protein SAMN02745124_04311 [Desulfofustis glycolicus DSM 9705]
MSSISHAERLELADKVYTEDKDKKLKKTPAGYTIDGKRELDSGLEIYALKKKGTNEVVFTVRGSDDDLDWELNGPNASHFRGKLHSHDEQAIRFVDEYIATAKSKKEIFNYSFAGDSKGGAIAQLLSWTFGFTGTASEPAACSAILEDPAYIELVATQLQTRNEPAGIVPGKFVNIFEIGSPVYNLSALMPGNGYVGVNHFFDLVGADFSETLFHAIASQHTEREIRIQILKSLKHPDGIDPVFVLTNMMISRYAEKIEALREDIMNDRENCAVLDESCATPQKVAELLKLESKMLQMIASRDEMISGAYGDDTGFVDQWAKDALQNAVVDPALLDISFFLPQQFQLPNDPDFYFVYASGRIVKAPALAGIDQNGTPLVLNEADQPQSSEQLIEQLQELGLSSEEARAIVDKTGFAQICSAREHAAEQLQAIHDYQVYLGEQLRVADLGVLQAQESLAAAVQADDLAGIVQSVFGYYAAAEQRAQLSGLGDAAVFDETFREILDTVGSALAFGQAVETQDGWSIVREGAGLLQQIDHYLVENQLGSLFGQEGSTALSWGTSGLGLLQALQQGNGWGIAQSSVGLATSLDNYFNSVAVEDAAGAAAAGGPQIDTTATALQALGSVIGLAMNLARLDDVLDSGDAGAIATAAASTTHYAVNTYNSISTLINDSTVGTSSSPGLSYAGYAAAALQLSEGDTRGAVTSAASTYLMSCPPYGWIFALVLQVGNMMISDTEPPEATAWFGIGEDGTLFVQVEGDSEMQEAAGGHGWSLAPVLEDYRAAGGRLMIDGSLPRLTVVGGDSSRITYDDTHGGKVVVRLDDLSDLGKRMLGVLYARDRGERLDSAVQLARGDFGEIDMAKVDTLMAGYGFTKRGMTYVTGETPSRQGISIGSGIYHGGGNQGPQNQLLTARPGDVRSLPVPPEQLPSQKMGEVARVAGLNTMFGGSGADLLAMALILPGGLLGLAGSEAGAASISRPDGATTGPLTTAELETYRRWLETHGAEEQRDETAHQVSEQGQIMVPPLTAGPDLHTFIATHWPDHPYLQSVPAGLTADTVYCFRENLLIHGWQQTGTPAAWWQRWQAADLLDLQLQQSEQTEQTAPPAEFFTPRQEVFSGGRVDPTTTAVEEAPAAPDQPDPEPPDQGPSFRMAEDTVLRFLSAELVEDTGSTASAIGADAGSLVALGQADNGRVWQDDNGDIRFAPAPGFVGTASFAYTVQMPDGTIHQQQANIVVENVNDEPQLSDDHFILQEGEVLALNRLLVNDTDPDGDPLVIDHLRGQSHGEVVLLGGALSLVPEAGFTGDIEFSYWVRDHIDSYPVMAMVNLTYLDVNTGPVAGDDRFLIMEDGPLITSADELLANDRELDGEQISFAGLGDALHGTVTQEPDGSVVFTPDDDYAGMDAGFSYLVEDQPGHRSIGWAAVEVVDRREPPEVTATTRPPLNEDELLVFSPDEVATFIADPDGDNVHLESISNVVGGSIITTDGYFAFVPEPDYAGPASFDYRATDNHRGTVDGHLAFTVTAVNDPVDTGHDELVTTEDQAVITSSGVLLANDTDVDGDVFSFRSVGEPMHGQVELAVDGTITFTPAADYCGDEAGFNYVVEDSEGAESTGWVSVRIESINDRPGLIAESLTILEDQVLNFDEQTLARFVTDVDGDSLTITDCRALSGGIVTEFDGLFTFVPTADYHGTGSLQVNVADPAGETVAAELSLTIEAVDDPTQFIAHQLATDEEQPVTITTAELLAGATDNDGPLTFRALSDTAHGSVSLTGDTAIIFTPEHNYHGQDAGFGYLVVDGEGNEASSWVSVSVTNINDIPEIIGDQLDGVEDQPIVFTAETLGVFLFDPDGDALHLTALAAGGAGQVHDDGGLFTFVPDPNVHGSIQLSYQAADGQGGELHGELQLNLAAVDDPTNFGDDRFRTQEEQALTTSVAALMANDEDGDGPLSFVDLGEASYGQVSVDDDGSIEFLPAVDYHGDQAGFSYTVRDADGNEATGWVASYAQKWCLKET